MKYPLTLMTIISIMGNSYSKIRVGKKVAVALKSERVRWLWKLKYHSQIELKDLTYK